MAPKAGMTQAQKLERMLQYFHDSRTCHTLKDLETGIPSATKINKMQVKDLLKELTDCNQVKVEKIGSGNWYWAWAGEETAGKRNMIALLECDKVALQKSVTDLESRSQQSKLNQAESQNDPQFYNLVEKLSQLEKKVAVLLRDKEDFDNVIAGGFESKQQEAKDLKVKVGQITDNIYALESWLQQQFQGDRTIIESIRHVCYGECFVEGEGLEDID